MNSKTQDSDSASLKKQAESVHRFAEREGEYYSQQFEKIQSKNGLSFSFNPHAALLGPLWASARNVWGFFWMSSIAILFALVQLGRGLWGELGADELARAERLSNKSQEMATKAQTALDSGSANADALLRNADNLQRAAEKSLNAADLAAGGANQLILWGALSLVVIVLLQGLMANLVYEKKYCRWRGGNSETGGFSPMNLLLGVVMMAVMFPLTMYRFTVARPVEWLTEFPANKAIFSGAANWLDAGFDSVALKGAGFFDGITSGIRVLLDGLEVILVDTPWPVTAMVILVMAWRLAGPRVAIFTLAALSYLAFLGYWEKSMTTVALLGTAATLCVVIGVPLGILCAKSRTAYAIAHPILDFMQTMPAFVYLIPIIAFFGTGKPPGILATLIFGMPPVVRLTALGIKQVPDTIVEAAMAFGCTRRKLLLDVEIPLAMPSIMTGVNQTILMCLSMVVIASLIGAEGLGTDVLQALQFAAKGQGLLAGLAILCCAMIIDRIVQGRFKNAN
ncbi:ABC transporter permease [Neptunomonas antarctica]|uniref:Glycine betaine/proline transport system permease protein n=1 Tax=Neptunomonas antarctica TaxID=619304 RepID=A0A1N7L1N4_9GAMM|nr:proline/glycine betaine ABC transporter permease [Neptunomonas antarctica]SIS67550.1 glycine betaine/proline transport system permease protein [Neptunomonas antarctica]